MARCVYISGGLIAHVKRRDPRMRTLLSVIPTTTVPARSTSSRRAGGEKLKTAGGAYNMATRHHRRPTAPRAARHARAPRERREHIYSYIHNMAALYVRCTPRCCAHIRRACVC